MFMFDHTFSYTHQEDILLYMCVSVCVCVCCNKSRMYQIKCSTKLNKEDIIKAYTTHLSYLCFPFCILSLNSWVYKIIHPQVLFKSPCVLFLIFALYPSKYGNHICISVNISVSFNPWYEGRCSYLTPWIQLVWLVFH